MQPTDAAEAPAGAGDGSLAEPPATGRAWRRAAGAPDPEPPPVRRVASGAPRERVEAHSEPLPQRAVPPAPPGPRIPPAPPVPFDGDERPIGTKRVAAVPRRAGRAPAPPGARGARPPGGRRGPLRRVGLLAALALAAGAVWFAVSLFQPFAGSGGRPVAVTVARDEPLDAVARRLADARVISSEFFFKLRARIDGRAGQIKAGRHVLREGMSYGAALDALTGSPAAPPLVRITIPEGRSRREIAPAVRRDGLTGDYLAATRRAPGLDPRRFGAPRGATLEGFLFPATYELRPGAPVGTLVAEQLAAFRRNLARVDLRAARRSNLTVYDVLVIASMVEREAGIARDRPLIAAVIYNRLRKGMPLGIDATLRYGLNQWTRPLRVSELRSDNPYNTRRRPGLPPTPIGNPGLASIEAAAHPAKVGYLFYVVKPCGNGAHAFSSTDAQFQRDVAAYERKRRALGGKSPVTCR